MARYPQRPGRTESDVTKSCANGSHRSFVHPNVVLPVTISGHEGDDALQYQERAVRLAIKESKR